MNLVRLTIKYFGEAKNELLKVVWPSRKVTISYTMVVILSIVIATGLVAAFDILLIKVVQFFVIR